MNPCISVIIPAYNRFYEVRDAVESVLRQKERTDTEIIVVDDASEPPLTLTPYMPLVTLIALKDNAGVSRARNIGAERAKGRYLAFLDSDDLFLPYKLSRQLAVMEKGALASHTDEHWYKENRFINQSLKLARYGGEIFPKILDKCRVSPSSFMIEREFFRSLGGFDEKLRYLEDYEFFLRVASRSPIEYIEEKLIIKRAVSQNSLSAQIKHIESERLNILKDFIMKNTRYIKPTDLEAAKAELERKKKIVRPEFYSK
jgi:glycosyltransferase involved in cell wall biosynthesis